MQDHLRKLSATASLPKDHVAYLTSLKRSGYEPKVIYDIGACILQWTLEAKKLWPNAEYVLFDAFKPAEFLYSGYNYNIGVLSRTDGELVKFYQNDMLPGGNSYYREIGFHAPNFPEHRYIQYATQTLDTVVKEKGFPLPDLVKIDVQGSERDVIEGGLETLRHADHLIVEMQHCEYNKGAPMVQETLPYIESIGWKCVAEKFSGTYFDADYAFVRK